MQYTPPKKPLGAINSPNLGNGIAKAVTPPQGYREPLTCTMYTEAQCLAARLIMDELYQGAQVATKADYAAFLARVTEQHSYTGQEWHTAGTACQMWRGQLENVRLRLAIKNLLTLEIEDIYSIMGGPELFGSLGQ